MTAAEGFRKHPAISSTMLKRNSSTYLLEVKPSNVVAISWGMRSLVKIQLKPPAVAIISMITAVPAAESFRIFTMSFSFKSR